MAQTNFLFKFIEAGDINNVPRQQGQFIIVDNNATEDSPARAYYDTTTGIRVELSPDLSNYVTNLVMNQAISDAVGKINVTIVETTDDELFSLTFSNGITNSSWTFKCSTEDIVSEKNEDGSVDLSINKASEVVEDDNRVVTADAVYKAIEIAKNEVISDTQAVVTVKEVNLGSEADATAILVATKSALESIITPKHGDMAIVKVAIGNSGNYQHTAYVYDSTVEEENWVAMDGNYNAENVYFPKNITITTAVGNVSLNNGSGEIPAAGKNIPGVFQALWTKEDKPDKLATSVAVTAVNLTGSSAKSYEVGTTITAKANATFNPGQYKYSHPTTGKTTGVTISAWEFTDTNDNSSSITENVTNTGTCDFGTFVIGEDKTYTITAVATHSANTINPVSNLGNEYTFNLASGTKSKTSSEIKSYREGFYYGVSTTKITDTANITSELIRELNKTGANYASGTKNYQVPVGTASIIFACPASKSGVTKVLNTTVNADMTGSFGAPITVKVGGADAKINADSSYSLGDYAIDYNVWVFSPADSYGSTADLTITLG